MTQNFLNARYMMLLDDTMGIILAFVNQLVFVFVQVHMYVHVEVRGQP